MLDSDSDSDCASDFENGKRRRYVTNDTLITFRPSDEIFEKWRNIPMDIRKKAAQRMKVCAFWLPVLLQQEETSTAAWAMEIGLISSRNSEELKMKHLSKIDLVETILFDMETGAMKRDQPRHVITISNMFNLRSSEVFENAVRWLEGTGDHNICNRLREFGDLHTCFTALHLIFTEFAKFIQEMGGNQERTEKALYARPDDYLIQKSDEMRRKGNESFQKQQYEEAVTFYSNAIKHYPDNHIIYGNRALCYLRCKKFLKAVGDGKRAILIKPTWAKGHYRFCEALFCLGEVSLAFQANSSAKSLCKDDQDGLKVLEQQHQKFIIEITHHNVERPRNPQSFKVGLVTKRPQSVKTGGKVDSATSTAAKVTEVKMGKKTGKNEKTTQPEVSTKDPKPSKSEKGESNASVKKKSKNRNGQAEDETQDLAEGKTDVCKEFRFVVQDAFTALYDLRSRNAEQAFSQALALLETTTRKELGLSTLDELLLLFGRALALTEIGQPEELSEAQKLLQKIKSYEERTFQCLVYYAIGRVYLRENRFAVALKQFSDSLQMVKNQITPGKLTWPLTKDIVKETQPDYFKELLESAVELCRFPPVPDAVCRLEKCLYPLKTEIYFTDPDFKGYIQICCCQNCRVEFHINCWKTVKTTTFTEKNEKDILKEPCLTPDCTGQICSIKIFGPTGLVKCKFETLITKPQTLTKPKVNQKCTSAKKLKSKEEHKLKRKQHKQTFQEKQTINDDVVPQKDNSAVQTQQKAWLLYRDRVLLQISQNMDSLREENGLHISALTSSLKPWLELDLFKGNQIAKRLLNWQQEPLETLGQAVELLLERKNRVWARVFIQQLSSCVDINPKLSSWAVQLNDAGLNAARSFIERYAEHLEQLDLSLMFNFGPLQEMIIEKLDTKPELFSNIGLIFTEYLKQAPAHDMRLFIWTLEEHRDDYVSCHTILDEYFDMMGGHCSVLKKSDENNSPIRGKSRGRKKKQREQKGHIVLSGMRGVTSREEWDQDFFEDDSLSFLHPVDPFSVPSNLREQVADFENQYNGTRHRTHFKKILDNNPDPTRECLYDYFAQILEEHGPLVADDPLLVGELEHFPAEAQRKFQDAGGFERFLLESLRFIRMGRCIGLAKHAVSLQQAGHGASLDDLDEIAVPELYSSSPDLYTGSGTGLTSYFDSFSFADTETNPILPSPYMSGFHSLGNDSFHWTDGTFDGAAHFLPNSYEELDLDSFDANDTVLETDSTSGRVASLPTDKEVLKRHATVQTCKETMRSVAVNTELLERFEICQGDINKKEKTNKKMEKQIKKMANGCDKVSIRNREELLLLEDNVKRITVNIQVTNKELVMFQQKLEEEVKKDQKEKKANQEVMKSLKTEIEQLVEEQASLIRNIREKKSSFDAKFSNFLELSNQSAAEKMSLEDEVKRCKDLLTSATRRSYTAQLSVVESSRDQGLYELYRELADAKALLTKLDEAAHRFSKKELEKSRNDCRAKVDEVEKNISAAEQQYKEQIDIVKNGRRACEVKQPEKVRKSNQPEVQLSVAAKEFVPQTSAQASNSSPPLLHHSASLQTQHKPATRKLEPAHSTVFEKAMETLASMFPDSSRSDLMRYFKDFRMSRGGNLNSMMLAEVVDGVTQMILDHQERLNSARASIVGRGSPAKCVTPPLANSKVWQSLMPQRAKTSNALNMEDPCIICHEDMSPEDTCVLECRHSFHEECIRSWLKEQSTCPTCRNHALLPDDFPALSGKRRQAL